MSDYLDTGLVEITDGKEPLVETLAGAARAFEFEVITLDEGRTLRFRGEPVAGKFKISLKAKN